MSKTVLIIAVIAGLGVIGAGAFFFLNRSNNPATSTQNPTAVSETRSTSLTGLLGLGINQQCTFQDDEGNFGTVYLGDGNARGDFTSSSGASQVATHMIVDQSDIYMWFDGEENGFTMSRSSLETMQEQLPEEQTPKTVDVNEQVDYTCTPWSVDATYFEPPIDVNFDDYSVMMESLSLPEVSDTDSKVTDPQAACAQCDTLPDEAQAQCRQVLSC